MAKKSKPVVKVIAVAPVAPVVLSLYQVHYVHRASPKANPEARFAFVVAKTEKEATAHVSAGEGHEVQGVRTQFSDMEIAGQHPKGWKAIKAKKGK